MDSSLTLDIFKKYLFLPERVLVSFFGFLAIVNAFIMSHVTEIFLDPIRIPHNNHSTEKAEILMILKRRLNFTSHRKGGLWKQKLWISKHAREDPYIFAFYIGFLITHIPGALIAERYGGKRVLIITLTIMSFITLATPSLVNQYGVKGLLILRIMLGLSEGPLFPAVCCMISRWIPSQERGSLATVVLSGGQIGILIVHLLSVVLYTHIRWTFVFYILGANALLLCICFILFCFDNHDLNPYIKSSEKVYLQESISYLNFEGLLTCSHPWRQILSSPHMWALISATMEHAWNLSTNVNNIRNAANPVYYSDDFWQCVNILLPFFLNWIVAMLAGIFSDVLIQWKILNVTESRKLMTAIAGFGPEICSKFAKCLLCNESTNFASIYNCSMGVMGTYYAGIKLTALDLSPKYAGTIMAIANTFGSIGNILAPYFESFTNGSETFRNIRNIMWFIITIFTSGEDQNFDKSDSETEDKIA